MKPYGLIFLSLTAGFAGGWVSNHLPFPARADGSHARVAVAGQPGKAVTAQAFQLVDAQGKVRASLEVGSVSEGQPGFVLFDQAGNRRAFFSLMGERGLPSLLLWNQEGKGEINLSSSIDGTASLRMGDKDGRTRLALQVEDKGGAKISFLGKDGKTRLGLYNGQFGDPEIFFQDKDGNVRLRVYLRPEGVPQVVLQDREGKPHMALMVSTDKEPSFLFYDKGGSMRAAMGSVPLQQPNGSVEIKPTSSLTFFDDQQRVVWEAPQ